MRDAKIDGRLPTLIFEIESGTIGDQRACVEGVRSLSKRFAEVANVIIILLEASDVLVFGKDRARERYVLVNDLTYDEAMKFVKARRPNIDEKDMKKLFDNAGTNPATLEKYLNCKESVDDFVKQKLDEAKKELVAFPLKPILKELKTNPNGVNPADFNNREYEGIDMSNPQAVGVAMTDTSAILYDMTQMKYKLYSQAVKVALQSYEPKI